jgi:hypothetical protein
MNEQRKVRGCIAALITVGAVLPLSVACAPQQDAGGAANVGYNQTPPPGYPAQPGAYPQQAQPQGYPAAQPGYAQPQPGYPQAQPQPGYPPAPGQPMPGQAPGQPAPSGSAPGPLAPTDPSSLQGILQGIQTAIQGQIAPQGGGGGGGVGGDVTMLGLKAYALHAAPGMQPEQNGLEQQLQQGQHAVIMFTMQAGKCYSIVGFSPPGGVQDLDLNLLAPPLYMTLAGQDLTHNNTPVIGSASQPMCPVIAFPLQYKLDVFARQGSGMVAVQLYSKNK